MSGKLTDVQIKKAKAKDTAYRLNDGGGLYVHIPPNGSKLWRYRYEFGGKEKLLSIGPYPDISLVDAREAQKDARADLREGKDPAVTKKQRKAKAASEGKATFEVLARQWHSINDIGWSRKHAAEVLESLETNVFPDYGAIPIREIDAPMVLRNLRKIEARGANHVARRVRQRISAVFVFAIASGLASSDPADIVEAAMAPLIRTKQPAVRTLDEARELLRIVETKPAHPVTRLAHRLLALTVVRPGTLTSTPWSEFADLSSGVWQIPAARMKLKKKHKEDEEFDHLVPLVPEAIEIIEALRGLTGRGPLVFPSVRHAHKPMSENAIGYFLNRAGYHGKHVPHGWRATFSTVMNEKFRADRQIIDLMLAHSPKEKVEGAYNRAIHLARRTELARLWADMLLKDQASVADLVSGRRR
jgi:integrase